MLALWPLTCCSLYLQTCSPLCSNIYSLVSACTSGNTSPDNIQSPVVSLGDWFQNLRCQNPHAQVPYTKWHSICIECIHILPYIRQIISRLLIILTQCKRYVNSHQCTLIQILLFGTSWNLFQYFQRQLIEPPDAELVDIED